MLKGGYQDTCNVPDPRSLIAGHHSDNYKSVYMGLFFGVPIIRLLVFGFYIGAPLFMKTHTSIIGCIDPFAANMSASPNESRFRTRSEPK